MKRGLWFALFSLACVAGAGGYVAFRPNGPGDVNRDASRASSISPFDPAAFTTLRSGPHVYYISMRDREFGHVAVAALDAPDDSRLVTDLKCDRVDFARDHGVCLADNRMHFQPLGLARIVDRNFHTLRTLELPGFPSRTRISRDERFAATTVFVTGESYLADFATRTTIVDLERRTSLGDLEQFETRQDGQIIRRVDFNFWGVTFADDSNRFYATLGTGGKRYLVSGDLTRRRMEVLRENVECPSLSPDQRHIAFKSLLPGGREWRLHVLELATMREWAIDGETRSVDDQVEWLDDEHVLYTVTADRGLPEEAVNVWVSGIQPGAGQAPRIFIRAASSPSVVRPSTERR